MDLAGSPLLSEELAVGEFMCSATASFTVRQDMALTNHKSAVSFEQNRATTGSGGALHVGESCAADLDRVDFLGNSATVDGGAVFVDIQGDLSLSRATVRENIASRNGGAVSAKTLATVTFDSCVAERNRASEAGGMLYLSGVEAAVLRGINASNNEAGAAGGAVAAADSTRTPIVLTNSTVHRNKVRDGGAISVDDSEMSVSGVTLFDNSVAGNGGGVTMGGVDTVLELSDVKCTSVDVLLDWTMAGDGCANVWYCVASQIYYAETCAGSGYCSGCPCNT